MSNTIDFDIGRVIPDFDIGEVETLPAGSDATASITGTVEEPLLNLGIPKGDKGDQGEQGEKGDTGYPTDAQVATATDAWLGVNVAQETGYVLDRTLTMQNAAAPADLVGDLKGDLNAVETDIGIYFPPSASGTTLANSEQQILITPISLIAGHSYTYSIEFETASDVVAYLYVKKQDGTNISSTSINANTRTASNTFTATKDETGAYVSINTGGKALIYYVEIVDNTVDKTSTFNKIANITNCVNRFDGELIKKFVNNGAPSNSNNARSYEFTAVSGKYYKASADGNNRFIVYGTSDKVSYTTITRLQNADLKAHNEIYFVPNGYRYIFITLYYGDSPADDYNFSVLESATNDFLDFTVKGVNTCTETEANSIEDGLNGVRSAIGLYVPIAKSGITLAYNGVQKLYEPVNIITGHKYVLTISLTTASSSISYFHVKKADGTTVSSTSISAGSTLGSVQFVAVADVANGFISANTLGEAVAYSITFTDVTSDTVPIIKKIVAPRLTVENVKLPVDSIGDAPVNLCLTAVRCIYTEGNIPDYDGYLYFEESTNKFYYSSVTPDNPVYVFDWDATLANNETPNQWLATITGDGDVIFLRHHQRQNPVVYPHTDYTSPYVVDFGTSKKPYGWLVGSSVAQFEDGSFVFGDYAYHSLTDEQNDDRRIIWKVSKPYNDSTNWVQAHSFKHVYYESSQSDEPDNEIGHIHAILYDYIDDYLYCTTGDIDRHCRMWISTDRGDTWSAVPGAVGTTEDTTAQAEGQKWRMTNAVFTADAIWWGTDAQYPYHILWKCTRNVSGHIDFSTLTEVADLEIFNLPSDESQRTYITALCRNPDGLLLIDRGEPRGDKLNLSFYSFETGIVYDVIEFERAETNASTLETSSRIGIPMQVSTPYMPQCVHSIFTGGGKEVRPNVTSIFNNSLSNYVGTMKLNIT